MKNQYLADINDYRKYGLLRALAGHRDVPVFVAWMLTANDDGNDGRKRAYLDQPHAYRHRDPELFDELRRLQEKKNRAVEDIAAQNVIPGALYHPAILTDDLSRRDSWFRELWIKTSDGSCVFFDPDNGLEVKSVKKGRRNSCKYLYWDEFADAWRRGHSVLVYQHYPRVQRAPYLTALCERMNREAPGSRIAAVTTSNVLFLLAMQRAHQRTLEDGLKRYSEQWRDDVEIVL